MHYFGVSQLWLKPISAYNVGTKYYHMQQNFDCTVVLKLDEANFQWLRSERPLGAIGKNITSVVK